MSDSPVDDHAEFERARRAEAMAYIRAFGDVQETWETLEALGRVAEQALRVAAAKHDNPAAKFGAAGRAIADWASADEDRVTILLRYLADGMPTLPEVDKG